MVNISELEKDPISKQILDLLTQNGIGHDEIEQVLSNVSKDIELMLWTKAPVSLPLLYNLKDVVWYNLEHLPLGGEEKGRSTLKWMGSVFPNFIFSDSLLIPNEKVQSMLDELEQIRNFWSNEWYFVSLKSKTETWKGGLEDPSNVIIYDSLSERPSKYGYNPHSRNSNIILDSYGNPINNSDSEVVLCAIESKLGSYGKEPLMRNLIESLISACKKALNFDKGVMLDVESYNYY